MEQRHDRTPPGRTTPDSVAVAGRRVPVSADQSFLRVTDRPRIAWSTEDVTVLAGGSAVTLTASGSERFDRIRNRASSVLAALEVPPSLPRIARPRLFGGFSFHVDHDGTGTGPWAGFPGALFVLPEVQLVTTDDGSWLTVAAVGDDATTRVETRLADWADRLVAVPTTGRGGPPGIRDKRRTPDRSGWHDQVSTAVAHIDSEDLLKVVLAQSLTVDLARTPDVPAILSRLAGRYPDCTRYLFEPRAAGSFFGATPERLVSVNGREVRTTALAGSTGRGDTEAEDEWLATELRESAKNRHEHEVVHEAIRDRLAPLSSTVEAGDRRVRKLATVQHLETPMRATLDRDRHVLDLVEALHPTPAVGGMPQASALRTIRDLEAFDRGWYAAPVGWIDAAGDGEFVVALRSGVAAGDTATLFAGNGIVEDSDPDREWEEVQLKYRPILDALT